MGDDDYNRCIKDKGGWNNYSLTPIKNMVSNAKKYVAGQNNVGVIKKNGNLYMWGSYKNGILCTKASNKSTHKPKLVLKNVKEVSMKYNHVLALKKDGTVWAWGSNRKHEISKSNKKIITKPIKIASNVKKISTGYSFSVILNRKGVAYWRGTL